MWKIRMGGRREWIFQSLSVSMDTGSLCHNAAIGYCACSRVSKEKKRTELGSGLTGLRESRKEFTVPPNHILSLRKLLQIL